MVEPESSSLPMVMISTDICGFSIDLKQLSAFSGQQFIKW